MKLYESLKEKANQYGEANDCSVVAVAAVLKTSYEDSHSLMKEFGRKDRKGMSLRSIFAALSSRGFELKKITIPSYIKTIRSFEECSLSIKQRPLLILTSNHIIAYVDGKINDYTSGRLHRITEVYEVVAKEDAIYSKDAPAVSIKTVKRKVEEYKYVMRHKETHEVFRKFKRTPSLRLRMGIENDKVWISGRKEETIGKIELVKL